jgi:hypothetical protein
MFKKLCITINMFNIMQRFYIFTFTKIVYKTIDSFNLSNVLGSSGLFKSNYRYMMYTFFIAL